MTNISVFKRKYSLKDGTITTSKNYFFWCNRKKINSHISNKKQAEKFAIEFVEEFEKNKLQQQIHNLTATISRAPTLIEKLQQDGWMVVDDNGKLDYKKNPKLIDAINNPTKSYGVKQAKQVGNILIKIFLTNKDELGNFQYNKITKKDAKSFYDRISINDMPNSMKNETMKALRAIFTYWDSDDMVFFNPFKKTSSLTPFTQEKKDNRSIFQKLEFRAIFDEDLLPTFYPDDKKWLSFIDSDYFKSFKFAALTGLRSGEIRCLTPSQFSNERILKVNRAFKANNTSLSNIGLPKWNKQRVIIVCDSAYNIIEDKLLSLEEDEYIFSNSVGNAIDASRWGKMFNYFMEMVSSYPALNRYFSGKHYTPHCLRKSLNTYLVNVSPVNNELIIDYFGWVEDTQSLQTKTQKKFYTKTTTEQLIPVANEIEKFFSGREMLWDILGKKVSSNELSFQETILLLKAKNLNKKD